MIHDGDLCVRAMGPEDAPIVQRCRNLPDVSRYQGWRPTTPEEVVELAHEQVGRQPGMQTEPFQLVIEFEDADGQKHVVGDMGSGAFDPGRQMEIGIVLDSKWQGRGFATRACKMLFHHMFEAGLNRVVAKVDPRNDASLKLFERLKFRHEGLELACWYDDVWNEWTDEVCFGILASEWRELHPS
jgi:RimJ/RimL family protein N-acetyltransferase